MHIIMKSILYQTYTHAAYTQKMYTHTAYTVTKRIIYITYLNIYSRILSVCENAFLQMVNEPGPYAISGFQQQYYLLLQTSILKVYSLLLHILQLFLKFLFEKLS
jgi:hypothetical protein